MKKALLTATALIALLQLSAPAKANDYKIIDEPSVAAQQAQRPQEMTDFDRPEFRPTVDAPAASNKPAIISRPPSMPAAVLPPMQPRVAAPAAMPAGNGPVETPPAVPPAAVEAPESLSAPATAAPVPVPAAPTSSEAAPAPEAAAPATATNNAVIDETAPAAAAPAQTADDTAAVPTMSDLSLDFSGNTSDLSAEGRKKLDGIAKQINDNTVTGRLQVRGFATGDGGDKSSARRISLSRVLTVRSYLMDKGVKPTRVDVRAMGTETDRSPLDRVDLIFERG